MKVEGLVLDIFVLLVVWLCITNERQSVTKRYTFDIPLPTDKTGLGQILLIRHDASWRID